MGMIKPSLGLVIVKLTVESADEGLESQIKKWHKEETNRPLVSH